MMTIHLKVPQNLFWLTEEVIFCLSFLFVCFSFSRPCALFPEARKLNVNRNTGETILHKAARLGYHVSLLFYNYLLESLNSTFFTYQSLGP